VILTSIGIGTAVCVDAAKGPFLAPVKAGCSAANTGIINGMKGFQFTWEGIKSFIGIYCSMISCNTPIWEGAGMQFSIGGKRSGDDKKGYSLCDILKYSYSFTIETFIEKEEKEIQENTEDSESKKLNLEKIKGALDFLSMESSLEVSKQSMVFAITCGCIPGIIHNLEKNRQINCWKGFCYQDMVPAGVPKSECDKQYAHMKCTYIAGQFFSILQQLLTNPIEGFFNMLADLISNPFAWALHFTKRAAQAACLQGQLTNCKPTGIGFSSCAFAWNIKCLPYTTIVVLESTAQLASMYESIQYMLESKGEIPNYCDKFLDE
jgi:hypothetical protein